MKKLWFKAKTYGYGWYPASWEGWAVMAVWLMLFLAGMKLFLYELNVGTNIAATTSLYLAYVAAITIALIVVAAKTGEKAAWRWGNKHDDKK